MLYNGEVSCQTLTGKISIVRLSTHTFHDDQELAEEEVRKFFAQPAVWLDDIGIAMFTVSLIPRLQCGKS